MSTDEQPAGPLQFQVLIGQDGAQEPARLTFTAPRHPYSVRAVVAEMLRQLAVVAEQGGLDKALGVSTVSISRTPWQAQQGAADGVVCIPPADLEFSDISPEVIRLMIDGPDRLG